MKYIKKLKILTLCILLIISGLIVNAQYNTLVHVDSIPTNLKFVRNGITYNLDFDLCIKNCPDSVKKYQPCRNFLFDTNRTASIREAYRTGVHYKIPFESQKNDQKHNAGYDDSPAGVFIYWIDRNVETDSIYSYTWRYKIFEDSLIKPWKIIQGQFIYKVEQSYIFNDDD